MYRLFARPGWGSVLVEAQLAWYGLPYEIEDLDDLFKSADARERLRPVNPLAQVRTLVLVISNPVVFDLDLIGFESDRLQEILAGLGSSGLSDPDNVPEIPDQPLTRLARGAAAAHSGFRGIVGR